MKRIFTFFIAFLFLSITLIAQERSTNKDGNYESVIRVKFKENVVTQLNALHQKTNSLNKISYNNKGVIQTDVKALDEKNKQHAAFEYKRVFRYAGKFEEKHREYDLDRWYEISFNSKTSVNDLIKAYSEIEDIEFALPVAKMTLYSHPEKPATKTLSGAPNDPKFTDQWHYNNTGQNNGTPGSDISLIEAWGIETGNSQVIVAIEDGGVDVDHPDLIGNIWINLGEIAGNGIDDDNNGYIDDVNGYNFGDGQGTITADDHGSHVSGTVAAETNNGIGVSGIAGGTGNNDGVRIMSCQVFGSSSQGGFAEAFVYAADMGAHISQNSWGGGGEDASINNAIDYFIANGGSAGSPMQGGVVIIAAGNSNTSTGASTWPAAYPNAIAVAATNKNDAKSYYSNYGTWVDISAPGGELETSNTDPTAVHSTIINTYGVMQGTSMACPHVSGVAALIVSKFAGNITPAQVRSKLIENTDNIDAKIPSYLGKMGSGRLNAYAALIGVTPPTDTQAPTAPTNLTSSNITETGVSLSWTASTDNIGVTAYDVYKGGILLSSTTTPSFNVTGLVASTSYSFYVRAKDAAGNISASSNTINVTTLTPTASYCVSKGSNATYEWISKVVIGAFTNTSTGAGYTDFTNKTITLTAGASVNLTLTPGFSGTVYNEYWKIWIDYNGDKDFDDAGELVFDAGSLTSAVKTGSFTVASGANGTTRLRVSMKYNAAQTVCETFSYGEVEDYTVTFGQTTPDTQAPSVPAGLASSNITNTSATVSWNASTDNVAVTGYEVYRNGALLSTVSSTSYTATGLTAATTYAFTVKAKDAAGNISAASSALNVTTSSVQLTYCASKGNNSTYEWIDLVQLNQINNTTAANSGYGNFTNLTATVAKGSSQTIYFSCGFRSSTYTEFWHVWIDWNQNGIFDAAEQMVSGSSSSSGTLSGTFTVPTTALLGTTRMRVTMKYNAAGTACETFSYGEVEDYTINVTGTSSYFFAGNTNADELGNESATDLLVYPNPANKFIHVNVHNGSKKGTINIYNMIGSLVKVVEIESNEIEIDISDLPAGSYIISVEDEKESIVKHFIKQ